MYDVMAKLCVPVCLMHMRGDQNSMLLNSNKEYPDDDVISGVRLKKIKNKTIKQ